MPQNIHCTYTSRGGKPHSKLILSFNNESESLAGHIVTKLKTQAEELWGSGSPTFKAIRDEKLPSQKVPVADTVDTAISVAFNATMDIMALEHG